MATLVRITIIRYLDAAGRQVPKGTKGARRVKRRTKNWYAQGVPGWPPKKRVALAADRQSAERMLADLVVSGERGRAGLPDESASRLSLAAHLERFGADLALGLTGPAGKPGRKPGPKQLATVLQRIRTALDGCGFVAVADLNANAPRTLAAYLDRRTAIPSTRGRLPAQTPRSVRLRRRKGVEPPPAAPSIHDTRLSHQSAKFYADHMKRFARWLAAARTPVPADLFDRVGGFDPKSNREHVRRECSPEELARVLAVALADTHPRRKPDGSARYHLYLTAFATGFRAEELARLTPVNFVLDGDTPHVVAPAGRTKNKKRAAQPLPAAVAVQLRQFLTGVPTDRRVWPGRWWSNAAKVLRRDLKAAGVAYQVETPDGPAVLDFHALRHSFVSALAAADVGPKELQELARHSDPRLTLGVYAHVRPARLAAAVERLAIPGRPTVAPSVAPPVVPELSPTAVHGSPRQFSAD